MDTRNTRQFYCLACDTYTVRAYSEIPLALIIELTEDGHTATEDPRCIAVDPGEIDMDDLSCRHCGNKVVLKTGKWKFIERE